MKKIFNYKIQIIFWLMILVVKISPAQSVDVENLNKTFNKKNAVKVSGGLNANGVWNNSTDQTYRDPYNWYLMGNINFSLFGQINLPFTYTLTNVSHNYQTPTPPNRIGVHPTYKWIATHIGNVSMTFSPYTLNGHLFTGGGVDLTPKGRFKISGMYGRLQKAVEYDKNNVASLPAYQRMGYGSKILYTTANNKVALGVTVFGATDKLNSLVNKPDSVNILPQKNLVTSFNTVLKPIANVELIAEYAMSALTKDIRDTSEVNTKATNLMSKVIQQQNSTAYYKALKTQANLHIKSATIGIGYERIDPGYKTLGAYFFANDLENVTINFAKQFLKNKISFSSNVGLQRDNLDDSKSANNKRYVFAGNLGFNPSQRISVNANYSNFQTYMNIKPLFQSVNQTNQFQNFDTLNYVQLAQNANLNLNFVVQQSKQLVQNINLNASYQDVTAKQGGKEQTDNNTNFYNGTAAYNIMFVQVGINLISAFNYSYNILGATKNTIMGPTLGITSRLLKKKLMLGLSTSYNQSVSSIVSQPKSNVINVRFNSTYTFFKNHNLMLSIMNQNRTVVGKAAANNVLGNIGYSYTF
ncbi:MAG: hypothetical protein RIQ33_493 [Bacteroidota bacterium]|jgi:hypothetical protein